MKYLSFRPNFDKGLILKQHMLEALRDYPQDHIDLMYANMGEGIISGLEISISENENFKISPGILKMNNTIYLSTEKVSLPFHNEINYVYLQVIREEKADGTKYQIEFIQRQQESDKLFEVLRYVKCAEMKEYKDIQEVFQNPMNRIDRTHVKQSIMGGSTLHSSCFKLYANSVLKNDNARIEDIVFGYQCLNGIYDIEIIEKCFHVEKIDNETIINLMKRRLLELQNDKKENKTLEQVKREERKMTIS